MLGLWIQKEWENTQWIYWWRINDGFVLSGPVGDRYIAYVAHTYLIQRYWYWMGLVELMCYYLSKQKGVVRYR
jgi:hypothetical protein